jgi:hypothetical protein
MEWKVVQQKTTRVLLFLLAIALLGAQDPVVPLHHAHAHNDYEHAHPLFDALAQGFGSVEADIFLTGGQLLVGHSSADLKKERTLEKLYLEPLRKRAKENGGHIYPGVTPFFLLIDVKTSAKPTYLALHEVLTRYADILTANHDRKIEARAVTVVVSGNRSIDLMTSQKLRYAGIDGRSSDLESQAPADLVPWISDRWGNKFRWQGNGPMPAEERKRLDEFVRKAHAHGRLVRFWATPERVEVWKELRSAGVDLLNTDQLVEMHPVLVGTGDP